MHEKLHRRDPAEKEAVFEQLAGALSGQENILFAYVYGSFLEDTPFHDIDVAIFLADARPAAAQRSAAESADRLEALLPFPADVRVLNAAPLPFLYHVISGRLIFTRDEDLRTEIVEYAVRRYLDIKPVLLRSTREAFAA